jgi:hypothetical protein
MSLVWWRRQAGAKHAGNSALAASHRRHRKVVYLLVALVVIAGVAIVGAALEPTDQDSPPPPPNSPTPTARTYRAFSADSYWNAPLPSNPPLDPYASQILYYMRNAPESGRGCLTLAGAGDNQWGHPIYWAKPSDPAYDVTGVENNRPPELDRLRIPLDAEPAANNDGTMSIYDMQKGYVTALTNASYDSHDDKWTATGATVTYLDSNGLNAQTGLSDDPRNIGSHRGNNGATMTVSWDMVHAGAIRHVLKVALGPEVSSRFVFPMVGSDGQYDGSNPAVPPQGLRLRIKPSVDLSALGLNPQALVIAEALQRYGFYIGDSGGTTALKLENTEVEGRGQKWNVSSDDLCGLPFTPQYWDVLAEGYDPSQ